MTASRLGKRQSPEHRAAIGAAHRGKKHRADSLARMSLVQSGERNPGAKLTVEAVQQIRLRAAGGHSLKKIAVDFEIDPSSVSLIVRRKRWANVPDRVSA